MIPTHAPPAFHVLAKPTGAICNLDCKYCFFLSKEMLYPGSRFRMADEVLEAYIRQYIKAQQVPEVSIAWQGGEPTLMGLDFFRRSVAYAQKYKKPRMSIQYSMQTNGTRLNDEWCEFFREHNFLIGLSLDGPPEMHDAYRVDKSGNPTSAQVIQAARLMQKHKVEFNILTTVHAANADYPLAVYRFLRDEIGTHFMQFIPIVERDNETGFQEGNRVTDRSVTAEQYSQFLMTIFDEWVRRDVGRIFVQLFDVALGAWIGQPGGLCVFATTCGHALALEHTGDLYACDHYVEPNYLLGNIKDTPMIELVASDQQRKFGQDKLDTLPQYCRACEVRFACHGCCPTNRFIYTTSGTPGLDYLFAGYNASFPPIDEPMRMMAALLRQKQAPAQIMQLVAAKETQLQAAFATVKRNDPCPCGSGRKFKQCHGKSTRVD